MLRTHHRPTAAAAAVRSSHRGRALVITAAVDKGGMRKGERKDKGNIKSVEEGVGGGTAAASADKNKAEGYDEESDPDSGSPSMYDRLANIFLNRDEKAGPYTCICFLTA